MLTTSESNAQVQNHQLKQKKLTFEVAITGDATPADKEHDSKSLHGVAILRTEGKTAEADAVEAVAFTTAVDATNAVFGILLKGSELSGNAPGGMDSVMKITAEEKTSTGSALAITKHGTDGLTAGGNIALSLTSTGTDLASESPTFVIEVDYMTR